MYAVVQIGGQQFKVETNQEIFVNKLSGNTGDNVQFDQVLLVSDNGSVKVGQPTLSGMSVKGTIVEHLKDEKVIVFKKKRRKGYKVKNGFRHSLTKVKIDSIA
jgi:large subunit ribosomal protein L21